MKRIIGKVLFPLALACGGAAGCLFAIVHTQSQALACIILAISGMVMMAIWGEVYDKKDDGHNSSATDL